MKAFGFILIVFGTLIDTLILPIFVLWMQITKPIKPEVPCSDGHCVFMWSDLLSRESALFWFPLCFGLILIGCGLLIIHIDRKADNN